MGGWMKTDKPKMKRNQKHNTIYFLRKIGDGLAKQHDEQPNYSRRRLKESHWLNKFLNVIAKTGFGDFADMTYIGSTTPA